MSKKQFSAAQWFQKEFESIKDSKSSSIEKNSTSAFLTNNRFPRFVYQTKELKQSETQDSKFSPINCFVPGWKGDSLLSKNLLKFERLMDIVQADVKNELLKTKDFPKSIKQGLFNEFLSYAETLGLNFEEFSDIGSFWNNIEIDKLTENKHLSKFIDIYANRVATITFLKLRFISSLIDRCGLEISQKALLYPTAYLSHIFKIGGPTELRCSALETNLYSWYRPIEGMGPTMQGLFSVAKELQIAEITKHLSKRNQVEQDQQRVYSHALSHLSMGLFLNSLQINFPLWIETLEEQSMPLDHPDTEKIISCKYFGDYLESLSLSHWLAQENNIDFRWDEILCPDFKGLEFFSGTFAKICNELQFLTFLSRKSVYCSEKPVDYICNIMGRHLRNRKSNQFGQGLLIEDNPFFSSTYDRVVLNLCQFPKNNPQHYLITQILDQIKYLKTNGYLFVLSSKKLFIPSLRERLEPILRELKTEAVFDFENVKGKGELGSYIYVFRKLNQTRPDKQLCSYFRFSADLENFQQFSSISEHLRSFYLANLNSPPTMTHLDFSDSFKVEYFQEAIVNGMLIHSSHEDSSRITHPSYFKGLLRSCIPLDTVFEIRALKIEDKHHFDPGLNLGLRKDLSYFIVVDFRQSDAQLELHPMDSFRSIYSDYGVTQCSYFQLLPKISSINPNLLRHYFMSSVGKQVTHLTFSAGPQLVKGSLCKFLIPKFLTETNPLPSHLSKGLSLLELNEEELLNAVNTEVEHNFQLIRQLIQDLPDKYVTDIITKLSNFESTLQRLIWKMNDMTFNQKVIYMNPVIQNQLLTKKTFPIYPKSEDLFIEFVEGTGPSDIHLSLTNTKLKASQGKELKLHFLELIHGDRIIIKLHGEEELLLLIELILSETIGVPISKLLRAVNVPRSSELKEILKTTKDFKLTYDELLKQVQTEITHILRSQISLAK